MSSYMSQLLGQVGESVTVRNVSKGTPDSWGNATETTTDYTISGILQILTADDMDVQEGRIDAGALVGFFNPSDTNATYLKTSNRVQYKSNWYEITSVVKEQAIDAAGANTENHIEVLAKRI